MCRLSLVKFFVSYDNCFLKDAMRDRRGQLTSEHLCVLLREYDWIIRQYMTKRQGRRRGTWEMCRALSSFNRASMDSSQRTEITRRVGWGGWRGGLTELVPRVKTNLRHQDILYNPRWLHAHKKHHLGSNLLLQVFIEVL